MRLAIRTASEKVGGKELSGIPDFRVPIVERVVMIAPDPPHRWLRAMYAPFWPDVSTSLISLESTPTSRTRVGSVAESKAQPAHTPPCSLLHDSIHFINRQKLNSDAESVARNLPGTAAAIGASVAKLSERRYHITEPNKPSSVRIRRKVP